jgi:hypothetical protein
MESKARLKPAPSQCQPWSRFTPRQVGHPGFISLILTVTQGLEERPRRQFAIEEEEEEEERWIYTEISNLFQLVTMSFVITQ